MDTLFLNEQRCRCGKLLLKGIFFDGTLEIKCKKCGTINKIGSIKLISNESHYLLIVNKKDIITNVSNSACVILGYTHEELIGKKFSQIIPKSPNEIIKKFFSFNEIIDEDNYFKFDTINKTRDGKNILVSMFLKLFKQVGKDTQILLSIEVKNDKNDDVENLEFSKNSCDFYFDINKNGIVEYVTPSIKDFFCYFSR